MKIIQSPKSLIETENNNQTIAYQQVHCDISHVLNDFYAYPLK